MSKIKLGDVTKIRTGKLDANASSENGKYPFFTCSKDPLRIDSYSYDCECVLVAGNGDLNVKYYKGKFDAYQRTYIIEDNSKGRLFIPYLYYFLELYVEELRKQSIGGVIKYIKLGNLTDAIIELPSIEKQKEIVNILNKSRKLVESKNVLLQSYDQLIKSRFVEMFGDPTQNSGSWNSDYLGNLLTIVRGASPRPIQSYITEEENGINWIKIGDTLKDSMFITSTKEKIKPEGVAKSRFVKEGDFLLSNSMSFGRPYILKTSGCVHDGWLVLSNYETSFNKYFLYSLLNSEAVYNQFKSIVVGGVVNNLNSEMVRNLKVIIPPMDIQIKFSEILEQVDKLKFEVQKSLDESQTLFDSLMQEYFG